MTTVLTTLLQYLQAYRQMTAGNAAPAAGDGDKGLNRSHFIWLSCSNVLLCDLFLYVNKIGVSG